MKCIECDSLESTFDERLGYHTCSDCGLVLSVEIFETSDKKKLTNPLASDTTHNLGSHIWRGDEGKLSRKHGLVFQNMRTKRKQFVRQGDNETHSLCMMFISPYKSLMADRDLVRDRIENLYQQLQRQRVLVGYTRDSRAAGLAYFMLKDEGAYVSLKEITKTTGVPTRELIRSAKKIAKFFRKSHIFGQRNLNQMITRCLDNAETPIEDRQSIYRLVEYIANYYDALNMRFADSEVAASIWIAGKMTGETILQRDVQEAMNVSVVTVRLQVRAICTTLNLDSKRLKQYNVNDVINGVRI